MRFSTRKRRQTPTVIIISLIDILIVILIFLMVTTTFKQVPSVKLALPESQQGKPGATDTSVIVTIDKDSNLYLEKLPVTLARLQSELQTRAAHNPQLSLAIRADTKAPVGQVFAVWDLGKAAKMKSVAFIKPPGQR